MPRQAIGIDIGGTLTKLAIVSEDGEIVLSETLRTAALREPGEYLKQLVQRVGRLAGKYPVQGIGLAAPGFLSQDRRSIRYNPNTPALVGTDFVSLLDPLHLPVLLEQDLNVPTIAEYYFGEFRFAPRLMTASIGTGLGAGFMIGNRLLDFAGSTIGDTGHIILEPGGPICTAGCHGCAEALIATPNIVRLAKNQSSRRSFPRTAHQVIVAAREEQPWAVEIIEKIGSWLGQWLASLSPIFLPSHIILCGGVAEAGEVLRARAEARYRALGGPEYTQAIIALSRFGGWAGVIGAAAPFLTNLSKEDDLADWIQSFSENFPPGSWTTDADELARYSRDAWPLAIKLEQSGQRSYLPELVFRPRFPEEVQNLLRWANQNIIPVTAWGAGSGVVGAALATQGGIILDLSGLDKILVLDETNLLVKVQAGMMGHHLEAELNVRGYTLNHSPQSLDRSTVGGWIATRACGQFSSRWGGIEDLALALTVALASGEVINTRLAPRAAIGPEIRNLFIGSEGTLGVVLDVTLKIFPLPEARLLETLSFPSVESGLKGMRRLMQSGLRPFLVRFYDEDESLFVARWSEVTPPPGAHVFIIGCEGLADMAGAEYQACLKILRSEGGEVLGPEIAWGWMDHRFDFSGVENRLAQPGGVAETIEIACLWDGILETHQALKSRLSPLAEHVLGHFSHAYPQGVSLYMVLLGEAADAKAAEQRLREIWAVAMRTSIEHGAAISHHHGIGLARQSYLRQELGTGFEVLAKIKDALDPQGILNPGKLGFRR